MSSYLEEYGASEEARSKRIRLIKISSIALVSAALVGLVLYGIFKNHGEERQAQAFVQMLRSHDYQGAYTLWGCTSQHPCRDYPLNKFMDDWGPSSPHADAASAHIGLSQTCGSGVVIRLDYKASVDPVPLWVERSNGVISFAPWPECPGRHFHIGAWLRSLFS